MKEKMNKNNIEALIDYRYQRSDELFKKQSCYQEDFYNAAVNRLYYACDMLSRHSFKRWYSSAYHSGMKPCSACMLKQKIPLNQAATYYIFGKRHSSDYDDFIYFDHEITQELIALTKEFTSAIKELVL